MEEFKAVDAFGTTGETDDKFALFTIERNWEGLKLPFDKNILILAGIL
jgi:hypothetical protein